MTDDSATEPESNLDVRRSDELASRLAYEWGLRIAEDALRTLEAHRTRSVTLLSVVLVTAGIATSIASTRGTDDEIQWLGIMGWGLFAMGIFTVSACAAAVAWPIQTDTALDPERIINHYVQLNDGHKTPAWVHQKLARDMRAGYTQLTRLLDVRNVLYKWAISCVLVVLLGAALVCLDATM